MPPPKKRSATMQTYPWNSPHANLLSHHQPVPATHTEYYRVQQNVLHQQNHQQATGFNNMHGFTQPISNSATLQSSQAPGASFSCPQRYLSATPCPAGPPNVTVRSSQPPHRSPAGSISHPRVINSMQYGNYPANGTWTSPCNNNASQVFEGRSHMHWHHLAPTAHQPAAPPQQTAQGNNIYQGQINPVDRCAPHIPTSQPMMDLRRPMDPSPPSAFTAPTNHSQLNCNLNQISPDFRTFASCRQSNNSSSMTAGMPRLPPPSYRSHLLQTNNQTLNQGSPSLPQDMTPLQAMPRTSLPGVQYPQPQALHSENSRTAQEAHRFLIAHLKQTNPDITHPQAIPAPDQHSSTSLPATAAQYPQSQVLRSDSVSCSIGKAASLTNASVASNPLMNQLLQMDKVQLQCLATLVSIRKARHMLAEQKAGRQQSSQDQTTATAGDRGDCTTQLSNGAAERMDASRVNVVGHGSPERSNSSRSELQTQSANSTGCTRRQTSDRVDDPELATPNRDGQKTHKTIAVVPPISQRVSGQGQVNDVATSSDEGPPFKIHAVRSLVKENDNLKTANPTETGSPVSQGEVNGAATSTDEAPPFKIHAVRSLVKENDNPKEANPTEAGSPLSQDPLCTASENDKNSCADDAPLDLSDVSVCDITLEVIQNLIKFLEVKSTDSGSGQATNVIKRILDLYFDGKVANVAKDFGMVVNIMEISETHCIKQDHAVVFQCPNPEQLRQLADRYQVLKDEVTFSSEEFTSLWLNVEGQPADVDAVLAEPVSDLALCRDASLSELDNTWDLGDGPSDAPDCVIASSLGRGAVMNSPICGNTIQSEASERQETSTALDQQDFNKQAESPSPLSSSDEEKVANDTGEEIHTPDEDFMEITLLSSEDAKKISLEMSEIHDNAEPPHLSASCPELHNPPSFLKFACPHVMDVAGGSDGLCPSCWNKTPLVVLDLEEDAFNGKTSPQKVSECNSVPSAGTPVKDQRLESSNAVDANVDEVSAKEKSGNPAAEESQACVTKPIAEETCNITSSARKLESPEVPSQPENAPITKPVSLSQTKILSEMPTPSRLSHSKKVRFSKACAPPAGDISLADLVKKNLYKQPSADPSREKRTDNQEDTRSPIKIIFKLGQHFSPTGQDSYQIRKKSSGKRHAASNALGTAHCRSVVPYKPKRPYLKKKKHDGAKQVSQNKGTKKVRLELFGSNRSHSTDHETERLRSTPAYLTISANHPNSKNYTDMPSARQKVFNRWSSALVSKQKPSKRKKSQKAALQSRIQLLKVTMDERRHQQNKRLAEELPNAKETKKLKGTTVDRFDD